MQFWQFKINLDDSRECFEVRIGSDLARLPVIVTFMVSDIFHNLGFRIQQPCAIASLSI